MAEYVSNITKQGMEVLTKVTKGDDKKLLFTKFKVGDGEIQKSQNPIDLTELIRPVKNIPITNFEIVGNGTTSVTGLISNKDLEVGFFMREYGLFVEDPETKKEVLYNYVYTTFPDWFPAYKVIEFGNTLVQHELSLITAIGRAKDVQFVIDESVVYVTRKEFNEYKISSTKIEIIPKNKSIPVPDRKDNTFYFQVV